VKGAEYLVSFGIGAMAVTLVLGACYAGARHLSGRALPSLQVKRKVGFPTRVDSAERRPPPTGRERMSSSLTWRGARVYGDGGSRGPHPSTISFAAGASVSSGWR
jgi:hypothetical protein